MCWGTMRIFCALGWVIWWTRCRFHSQEPELRRRIGQREREAFLTYGFPWVELQESAARQGFVVPLVGVRQGSV